jgi:hypothetical protein
MKVDCRPRRRNAPRIAEKSAPGFLQWLRGRECAWRSNKSGGERALCEGRIVAAHVDHAGGKGIATRVADRHAIPLCDYHHRCQHIIGWRTFERRLPGGDAVKLAEAYWSKWPGRIAWERKLSDG